MDSLKPPKSMFMQTTSLKTTLTVIFACIILLIIINYITKKSDEEFEQTKIMIETNDKLIDESITVNTTYNDEQLIEDETIKDNIVETTEKIEDDIKVETKLEPAFYLNDYERRIVECVVMGEAGAESYEGQVLVAQCLLNGCIKEGVQPSVIRRKYKYSGWKDNPTDSVKKAVSAVFDDGYKITNEFILYFYAPKYVKGKWHETQRFVIEEGNHRFFAGWN